jgi:catalase (peroxidase I)
MKNIEEVLKQKEARMQQLRVEIEALRVVAPMLGAEQAASAAGAGGNVTVIPSSPRQDDKVDLSSFLNDVNS